MLNDRQGARGVIVKRVWGASLLCIKISGKGELLIGIMSSLAQEESRSISENVTWGQRKRFADGKVSFAYIRFLGLDKDKETGKIVINSEQAETVKLIYHLFLEGMTPHSIATELTRRKIKNAHIAQDQEEYQKRYDGMVARYDAAKTKFDETIAAISAKEAQSAWLTAFVKALR